MSILDVAVAAKIATGGTTVTKRKKRPPRPVAVAAPELELELGDPGESLDVSAVCCKTRC